MGSFFQSLFPCLAGGGEDQEQAHPHDHERPSTRKEGTPRTSSNTSTSAAPIPVSQAPAPLYAPSYRPDTDKTLPPQPGAHTDSNAIELPGSSPDLFEMPATYMPGSHPLARPSNATPTNLQPAWPSQPSEQTPTSPYSTHSFNQPGSAAGSSYQPSGSVRAPSERGDPDEISPIQPQSQNHPRGANPSMYANVADALSDRKRMFERLRKTNGPEGQQSAEGQGSPSRMYAQPQQAHTNYSAAPVEMEAPVQQQPQAPSELAAPEHQGHLRQPSGPRELE